MVTRYHPHLKTGQGASALAKLFKKKPQGSRKTSEE
jgi:hypothetical protein